MSTWLCYWLEESGRDRLSLRRYRSAAGDQKECPIHGYHDASAFLEDVEIRMDADGRASRDFDRYNATVTHDDPRWPKRCDCGYEFVESDTWQVFPQTLYRRADTGEEMALRDAPPGALWNAWWRIRDGWTIDGFGTGPDGMIVYCKTPGRDWCIDSRASNCGSPTDNEHRCWVRHGDPRDPQGIKTGQKLHVDKNGRTCSAGAGSIQAGDWHGFLHNGSLVTA